MIRVTDQDVYVVQESEITRGELITFFCGKKYQREIVVVYNGETFKGIITYDYLLTERKNFIQELCYKIDKEDHIDFEAIKEVLRQHVNIDYIPILS